MIALLLACVTPGTHGGAPASASRKSGWSPGDEIPGWEDADCSFPIEGNVMEIQAMDTWRVIGTLDTRAGLPEVSAMAVDMRDCATFGCEEGEALDPSEAFTSFRFSTEVELGEPRGQGWYGPDEAVDRPTGAAVYGVVGLGYNEAEAGRNLPTLHATACVRRARPDMVSGVLYWQFYRNGRPVWIRWYDTMDFWSEFTYTFADHAGITFSDTNAWLGRDGEQDIDMLPEEWRLAQWRYRGVTYDDAWPWAEITDADVRAAVYERYSPSAM